MQYLLILNVNVVRFEAALIFKYPAISEAYAHAIASTFREIFWTLGKHSGDVRLGEMESTSQDDRQLMIAWNPRDPFASMEQSCMHHLVEIKVKENPTAEAVHAWDCSMTYAELVVLADSAAQRLANAGVGPGVYVPFAYEKSAWVVVATLAILKAGGALVPINPDDPAARLADILRMVDAVVVVTMDKFVPKFSSIAKNIIVISKDAHEAKGGQIQDVKDVSTDHKSTKAGHVSCMPTNNYQNGRKICPQSSHIHQYSLCGQDRSAHREVVSSDPMIVLFTSGSTGRPKGIILEHSAICTHALVHGSKMKYHGARVLQFAAHTFDVAIMDIFTTLLFGGCICIPSEEERKNGIVEMIYRTAVDHAILTPSFAGLIDPSETPTLKTLAVGGEALPQDRVQNWAERVDMIQIYGPAEVGICLTMNMKSDTAPEKVGFPLINSSCWLVDPDDYNVLVPVGAVGELAVAGPSLAKGYLNNEAKTSASFIVKPAWAVALELGLERFYLTGDLLRYNTSSFDGSLDIVGRKDAQIKLRGQRIEPAEIEYHIGKVYEVAVSMVTMPRKGCYANELVCVVQMQRNGPAASQVRNEPISLSNSQALTITTLREQLARVLPSYMIPSTCLVIDTMPLVTSLKIDRRRVDSWLADLDARPLQQGMASFPKILPCEITANKLSHGISRLVAAKDEKRLSALEGRDFAVQAIGVNSIQIMSLAMYLRREHNTTIPMESLLSPELSICTLAHMIDKHNEQYFDPNLNSPNHIAPSDFVAPHIDVAHEVLKLSEQLLRSIHTQPKNYMTANNTGLHSFNVFLTGATGYLGSTVLRRLMEDPRAVVFALVRCRSQEVGLQRIIAAAELYKWWQPSYSSRIHVWVGDLTKMRLGLDPENIRRLQGWESVASREPVIHSVIHNGARVHYNSTYASLFPPNVNPTVELLNIVASSRNISNFVFVSGGLKPNASLSMTSPQDMKVLHGAGGYAQTKFVSESLVQNCVSHPAFAAKSLRVVKPGYIIGSAFAGVANTSDFIWRMIAGCIEIGAYNIEEAENWVFSADVEEVAQAVVDGALLPEVPTAASRIASSGHVEKILSGLPFSQLWNMLRERFGYHLQALEYEEWMKRLKAKVLESQNTHPLFPLLHVLERDGEYLGEKVIPQVQHDISRVLQAVESNVQYLINIGFLPQEQA